MYKINHYIYVYIYTHTYMYIYVCIYMHTHMCVYMCVYTYTIEPFVLQFGLILNPRLQQFTVLMQKSSNK